MRAFDKKPLQDEKAQKPASRQKVNSDPNRHQQILQMQRQYGNKAVRRMIQREDDVFGDVTTPTTTPATTADSSSTSIGDGTASISAENGTVTIDAAMVNINAALTSHSGIDESDTVMTNTVIASTYTPGAGNVW
jgi:hypothetical protein